MTELALGGLQLALEVGHRARLGRRRPPPSDGGDQLSPGVSKLAVIPNSDPTTSADLPLLSQFWTASRLKVSSNFRRLLTDVVLMDLIIHDLPNSLSVNSKQPQTVHASVASVCSCE